MSTQNSQVHTSEQSFPREFRLRSQADFDRVYAAEVYAADGVLVVCACANELRHPRLGLSVSRKVGKAVVRNRWKRLIREAFRLQRTELPRLDLVVRPKRGADPDFHAIAASLRRLAQLAEKRLKSKSRA